MPRARINDATEDVVLPKPRARKPRAISVDGDNIPAPRKRAAPRPRAVISESAPPARKAPTQVAARRRNHSRNSKSFFAVLGICLLITGMGIGIGFMDTGVIDVVAVVSERNEKINKGEVRDESGNAVTQTIQVQTDTRPNGGLPMGDPIETPPTPPPPVATTTASTTAASASSTETMPATEATVPTEESI